MQQKMASLSKRRKPFLSVTAISAFDTTKLNIISAPNFRTKTLNSLTESDFNINYMSSSSNSIEEQSNSKSGFKQLRHLKESGANINVANIAASFSPVITALPAQLQLGVKLPKTQQLLAVKSESSTGIFYKECPKHIYKILDAVCLDSKCKHRTIICGGCKDDAHRGHKTIHLRHFLDNMKDRASGTSKSILVDGSLESMKDFRRNFNDEIAHLRDTFERTLQEVERKTNDALDSAEAEFSNSNNLDYEHRSLLEDFKYDHADDDL